MQSFRFTSARALSLLIFVLGHPGVAVFPGRHALGRTNLSKALPTCGLQLMRLASYQVLYSDVKHRN